MVVCDPFRQGFRHFLNNIHFDKYQFLSNEYWFLGLAKSDPWVDSVGNAIDNTPPTNIDSVESQVNFKRNMLFSKRIFPTDVSLAVRRVDWEANQIYTQYDDDVDLFNDINPANFYVLVEKRRVYKCISNNSASPSTVAPTHTDTSTRQLSDGYRWKFLYTITEDNDENFLLDDFMPVEYINDIPNNATKLLQWDVQQAAVDGSIEHVEVESVGATFARGILPGDLTNVFSTGISAGSLTGFISSTALDFATPNAIVNYAIKVDTGPGEGQQRRITQSSATEKGTAGNPILQITVDRPYDTEVSANSSTFSISPSILVRGDGSSNNNTLNTTNNHAEFVAVLDENRRLSSITVQDAGKNYSHIKLDVLPADPLGDNTNQNALARAVVSPEGGHGSNAPLELGASKIIVRKSFVSNESSEAVVDNDFRQFGLIRNPELSNRRFKLQLLQPTSLGDFVAGETATQGFSGGETNDSVTGFNIIRGTVVSFDHNSITGCSELVVDTVKSLTTGTVGQSLHFQRNGIVEANGGVTANIVSVDYAFTAGSEATDKLILSILPTELSGNAPFSENSFVAGKYVFGDGNSLTANGSFREPLTRSFASGRIKKWTVNTNNDGGDLDLVSTRGVFNVDENISEFDFEFKNKVENKARIQKISSGTENAKTIYDQRISLNITGVGGDNLTDNSFVTDASITFSDHAGTTAVIVKEGVVLKYASVSGELVVTNAFGDFSTTGEYLVSSDSTPINVQVIGISHSNDLKINSGDVEYIQNIRPIIRGLNQTEEARIILGF